MLITSPSVATSRSQMDCHEGLANWIFSMYFSCWIDPLEPLPALNEPLSWVFELRMGSAIQRG